MQDRKYSEDGYTAGRVADEVQVTEVGRAQLIATLGDKDEVFAFGRTIRRCADCKEPVCGGPTRCTSCAMKVPAPVEKEGPSFRRTIDLGEQVGLVVEKLEVKTGDVLVFRTEYPPHKEVIARLRGEFDKHKLDPVVLFMSQEVDVEVMPISSRVALIEKLQRSLPAEKPKPRPTVEETGERRTYVCASIGNHVADEDYVGEGGRCIYCNSALDAPLPD